jgi:predicted HicB family RNase H-like nuclease
MSKGTGRRTVRIAPELWERAGRVALSNGETLSDVIRRALEEYAR